MANKYWVGGGGIWDNFSTQHWSLSSGGLGYQTPAPTSADTVTIDGSSGNTAFTISTSGDISCLSILLSSSVANLALGANVSCTSTFTQTGGTIYIANSATITCLTFVSTAGLRSIINDSNGTIRCTGTGTALNIVPTSGTITVPKPIIVTFTASTSTAMVITTGSIVGVSDKFNINIIGAGAKTHTITANNIVGDLSFGSSVVGSLVNSGFTVTGNLTLGLSTTVTAGTNAITFAGSNNTTQLITSNSKVLDCPIKLAGSSNTTYNLVDNLTIGTSTSSNNRELTLSIGNLNLNGKTLSCGKFTSNNTNIRTITQGTGGVFYCYSPGLSFDVTGTGLTVAGSQANNIVNIVGGSYTLGSYSNNFTFIVTIFPAGFLSFFF